MRLTYVSAIHSEYSWASSVLSFPCTTNVTPVNEVSVTELRSFPWCFWLDTKLCCLSQWAFSLQPGTYQLVNKWCSHGQTMAHFRGLYQCISPATPLLRCLHAQHSPLTFPFLSGHWRLELELEQLFITLYVACDTAPWTDGQGRVPDLLLHARSNSLRRCLQVLVIRWLVFVGDLKHVCMVYQDGIRKKKCLKYAVKVSVAYQFIVAFMYVVLNRVHTVSTVTLTEAQPWGEMLCTYASSTALWAAPTLLYQILTIITRFRHFWFHASYGRHTDKLSMVLQLKKKKKGSI